MLWKLAAAGICRRLLFCFSSPHGRWFWVGGGLSVFSCVSQTQVSGVMERFKHRFHRRCSDPPHPEGEVHPSEARA